MTPHLWPRQIVRAAVDTPHPSPHLGIEHHPVRRVGPLGWNASNAARPGLACVFTAEEADIGIGDELPLAIKRIEMNTVIRCHVEAGRSPLCTWHSLRIFRIPILAAIRRRQGAP